MSILRRTALRAISANSSAFISKSRTYTTFSQFSLRTPKKPSISTFQRRFASDDAVPPTAATTTDETVTESPSKPEAEAQQEYSTEASGKKEQSVVDSAIDSAKETVENIAQRATEAAQTTSSQTASATQSARDTISHAASAAAAATGFGSKSESWRNIEPNNVLYVGNLFFEVTEDQLKQEFSRIGEIKSTKIVYDHRGLSKGFGYVEFNNQRDATAAIDAMNQQVLEGRRMTVQYHKPREQPQSTPRQPAQPSKTLFIGNMSFEMSDRDLNDLFREIKNVLDVRIAIDRRSGQPRGFAHADFTDVKSAERAKEALEGKEIYGRKLRVDFSANTSRR